MSEARYTGEDVLAMLEQHHVDPEDLPNILLKEQNRRRNALMDELYGRIISADNGYDVVKAITDVEILHGLIFMFMAEETLRRDQAAEDNRALIDEWLTDHDLSEGSAP